MIETPWSEWKTDDTLLYELDAGCDEDSWVRGSNYCLILSFVGIWVSCEMRIEWKWMMGMMSNVLSAGYQVPGTSGDLGGRSL